MVTENIKLDQIIKSLFEVSSKAMIGVINECFGKNYNAQEVTIERIDPNFIKENMDYEVIKADIILKIDEAKYHIEFQTLNDKSMEIRLFEYGFYLARQEAEVEEGIMTLRMPNQAVIFIEENANIRQQRMRIVFPNGEEMIYDVETIRFWEYSITELRERRMYNLLPLTIFKHRKVLQRIAGKLPQLKEEKKQLLKDINEISQEVKVLIAHHELEGEDVHKIALAMTNIAEYLNSKYMKDAELEEEVICMTKTLYDPLVEERGRREGIKEGIKEERFTIARALLDILDNETIALKTGLSVEEVADLRTENKK